jgi:N-acetyl-gamma-glutamyl-phosphate reductase
VQGIDARRVHYYALIVNKIPVGVLGASGYAGRELCALINTHPCLDLVFATANEQAGARVQLGGRDVTFVHGDDVALERAKLVCSALPHGASHPWVERCRTAGLRVVDLSADLRPGNEHEGPPYGLTELNREAIAAAGVVANPGCYPTAILLGLAPLVRADLLAPGSAVIVDAASGVSGAGNSPKRELLFAEIVEDYRAYGVGNGHRHLNEMRAQLGSWRADVDLVFTPHLLPVARGILASITVTLRSDVAEARWRDAYREAYAGEPFVTVVDQPPSIRAVSRRNVAHIHATALGGTRRPMLLVLVAIDNLVKGAAGQAVQNANVMLGLPEPLGLPA